MNKEANPLRMIKALTRMGRASNPIPPMMRAHYAGLAAKSPTGFVSLPGSAVYGREGFKGFASQRPWSTGIAAGDRMGQELGLVRRLLGGARRTQPGTLPYATLIKNFEPDSQRYKALVSAVQQGKIRASDMNRMLEGWGASLHPSRLSAIIDSGKTRLGRLPGL
jgi:hypothetical protein